MECHPAFLSETPPHLLQHLSLGPPHRLRPLHLPQHLRSPLEGHQQPIRTLHQVLRLLLPLEGLTLGRHFHQHHLGPLRLQLNPKGFLLEPITLTASLLLEHRLLLLARRLQECPCHSAVLEHQDLEQWAAWVLHHLVLHQPASLLGRVLKPLGLVDYKHAGNTHGRSNTAEVSPTRLSCRLDSVTSSDCPNSAAGPNTDLISTTLRLPGLVRLVGSRLVECRILAQSLAHRISS